MKTAILSILCVFFQFAALSQITDLGGPLGWNTKIPPLQESDFIEMKAFNLKSVKARDKINDTKGNGPWKFGYKYETNLSSTNAGKWTKLASGGRLWRLGIKCKGAQTINFILKDYSLPEGAYLYLYDANKTNRVGAYTHANNRKDGLLGTELVHGESVIIEYYEPATAIDQGKFTVSNVIHGYRSLNRIQESLAKGLNSSADCNIDVNCPLGDDWTDQIRSVAMIIVGGNGVCTGALINNTCSDGTPYFLTADHCLSSSSGTWAFRFNWESPESSESCATTNQSTNPGQPYDETANGATVLANDIISDFALLRIDQMTITNALDWGCFYAGWDNSDDEDAVDFAIGVHHPKGDLKKICKENEAPYHSIGDGAIVWWIDDWDQGVTESGSSGSPLFNQDGRIIGQLFGGEAACSGTADNGRSDFYGRFGISWVNGISPYLAPTNCGSSIVNIGYDPNTPVAADDAGISGILNPLDLVCSASVAPEIVIRNFGSNNLTSVTLDYSIDDGAYVSFPWVGTLAPNSSQTITLPNITLSSGSHKLNVSTSNPNNNIDANIFNDSITQSFISKPNTLLTSLTINTDCWGYETAWELYNGEGTFVTNGGNLTIIPGGGEAGSFNDPGAYGNEITITENICLEPDCYEFIIFDDGTDGMYGEQHADCNTSGGYSVKDAAGTVLASIIATNSDFGSIEKNNFCVIQSNEISTPENESISVYPNPANTKVNIVFKSKNLPSKITLIDMMGRVLFQSENPKDEKIILDTSEYANGMYLIHIYNDLNAVNIPLVVSH